MTTVKVECNCGQRFAFDVEPIHGRMPAPVACPTCGADGTAAANAILARTFVPQALNAMAPATMAPMGMGTSSQSPAAARLAIATPAQPVGPPPIPAAAASRPGVRAMAAGAAPKRGKDGWGSDETSFNKVGTYIVMLPSILAALATWGLFGIEIPITILCFVVGVCGLIGGVINLVGRGPVWAGALIGLMMALGGYGAVSWWIHGRGSVFKFEMAIAFALGAAPGFLLQYVLQQVLKKRSLAS